MKRNIQKSFLVAGWYASFIFLTAIPVHAGQFFQDFGACNQGQSTNFGDGSQLFSTSLGNVGAVADNQHLELQLTAAGSPGVSSAYELPALDPSQPVYAFSVKWNSQIYGNQPLADGFSFNYGQLDGLNLTNGSLETGYGVGLCLSVKTYVDNAPGFYLTLNGITTLASLPYNPTNQWGAGNGTRHFWEVDWNYYTGMTVCLDGQILFTNVPTTGFSPHAGDRFVWGARCGDFTEEFRLDNIVAVTGGNLVSLPASSPYYANGNTSSGFPAANAFDGTNNTEWMTSGDSGYVGATVLPPAPVAACVLVSAADESGSTYPQLWTVDGSTNGGTLWTPLSGGAVKFLNGSESRSFLVTNSTAYDAYRLNIITNSGGDTTTLGDLRFYAFSAVAGPGLAGPWTLSSAPVALWDGLCMSADGTRLAAASEDQGVWVSTDGGQDWHQTSLTTTNTWYSIAGSSNGMRLAAVVANGVADPDGPAETSGGIYCSTNGGATWFESGAPDTNGWASIAASADGMKLVAGGLDGSLWNSTNGGTNWDPTFPSSPIEWTSAASSADGMTLTVASYNEGILISTNGGSAWFPIDLPPYWLSAASSSDGTDLLIGGIYGVGGSGDAGQDWFPFSEAPTAAVAISADASVLAAADAFGFTGPGSGDGDIYISTDGGEDWTDTFPSTNSWFGMAMSADGTKIAAVAYGGGIYVYNAGQESNPQISLGISSGYPVISWPDTTLGSYTLLQSTNLASGNWTTISVPISDVGGKYQMTVLPAGKTAFYQLIAQ